MLLVFLLVALFLPAADAEACEAIDLLCQINELDRQLGMTNAAVGGLSSAVGILSTQLSAMKTAMQSITTTFDTLSKDLIRVVGMFNATMDAVSSDTMALTSDLVMRVEDARKLVDFFIMYERDSYLAFVGTTGCSATCEAFRGEIVNLIEHVESSANLGYEALASQLLVKTDQPLPPIPKLDLSLLKQVLQAAPGVVLYGLYRSIPLISVQGELPAGISSCEPGTPTCALAVLNGILSQGEEAFRVVIDLAEASAGGSAAGKTWPATSSAVGFEHQACLDALVGDLVPGVSKMTAAEYGSSVLTVLGGTLKGLGLILESYALSGLTEKVTKVGASVMIHAAAELHSNEARLIGRALKILGNIMARVGAGLEEMVAECRTRLNNAVVICWLSVKNPIKGNDNQPSTYQWCFDQIKSGASF